jgi:hypothetical protein
MNTNKAINIISSMWIFSILVTLLVLIPLYYSCGTNYSAPEVTPAEIKYLDPCGRKTPDANVFNSHRLESDVQYFEKNSTHGYVCGEAGCRTESEWLITSMGRMSGMGPGAYNDSRKCIEETLKQQ